VTYIGHNQGNTQLFAALCENPEFYKDRMNLFVAISPAVCLDNSIKFSDFVDLNRFRKENPEVLMKLFGSKSLHEATVESEIEYDKHGAKFGYKIGSMADYRHGQKQ